MKKQIKLFTNMTKPLVLFLLLMTLGVGQSWADMYLAGTMNSWAQTDATKFVDNKIEVTLDAETTYEFKIVDSGKWRSCDASITNTSLNYELDKENVDGYNISITTGEAGTYIFQYSWYDDKHHFSVYYPQSRLKKNTVLYFDGRNSTRGWGTFPWGARFFYKYYDSGGDHSSVDCTSAVEEYVHYTTVPNHDYLGQIQVERKDPSDMDGERWNYTGICCAYNRDNSAQNCMAISNDNKDWDNTFIPVWTTYCPPMSDVDLEEDGTTLSWGGNGSSGTPYLIPTGASIKVKATNATSAVDDDNMTVYYKFKKAGTEVQAGSTTASATITASGSTGTKEAVTVEAYNYYNATSGTHFVSNEIYYEVRSPYTISYNKGTNGTGSRDSETKLKGVNFTLPNSAVFTRNHYTQTGWTTSDGGTQTHALGGSYTSDAAQEFFPVWTDNKHSVTVSAGSNGSVSTTSVSNVGIETTSGDITATPNTGYYFTGWTIPDGVTLAGGYALTDATIRINATADSKTITANFALRWAISTNYDDWSTDDHIIGNISTSAGVTSGYVAITLPANTNYGFKIFDKTNHWLGYATEGTSLTYSNSGTAYAMSEGNYNLYFTTAGAGSYRFTWDITNSKVTITYPTSWTVTYGWQAGMPDGTGVTASVGGNALASGGYAAAGSDVTFTETHPTGFTFNGWFTTQDGNTPVSGMGTSDNVLDNIGANATVYAQYSENHFDVTAAASPATGGTVTPTSATSFGQYYGGDIFATPYIGYGFTGWTGGTGAYVDASSMSTKFKPTATSTVTAGFSRRYAFIEGNFQIYDQARSAQTKTGNAFTDESTAIPMEWDDTNHRFYLHTYSTPAELAANLNNAAAWFYIMTSAENNALSTTCAYKSASGTNQNLAAAGAANKKSAGYNQTQSFHFTGSDDAYVIIYFDGNYIWYELEAALSYNGNTGTGDAPAARTYYAYGSNQTAASNTYSKTGYNFANWNTASGGGGTTYAAGATNVAMNAREVCLHAQWTAKEYTINLANMEATTAGSESVTVTYDASTNMTASDPITKPTKTNYDFGGYWTSENIGVTLDHQLIGTDGKWIADVEGYTSHDGSGNPTWVHDYPISLYAKWTETAYTITPSVSPAGAGSVNTVTDAHLVTSSSEITATPANAAWVFDHWELGTHVGIAGGKGTTDNPITVTSDMNSTITAYFKPRYVLVGSVWNDDSGEPSGGMPGWMSKGYGADFTFNSFTALGTSEGTGVDLSCSRTLTANTTYKFQIYDRIDGNYGYRPLGDGTAVFLGDGDSFLFDDPGMDVWVAATGAGKYTFRITNITLSDGHYYPTVTIERPHQVYFGTGYAGIDNLSSVTSGTTGGTLAVTTSAGSLSNEDWVTYGTDVTYTPSAATGYTFEGFYTSNTYSSRFTQDNPWVHYNVTGDDNVYAKFEEKSTSVTLASDGNGKVQISSTDKTSTTCGVTTTRELTAVPNDGYMFSSWTKTSGDDIAITSTNTNPTTLRGQGAGATSGQTVTANFTYRWALKAETDNWGSSEFIIGNIATVSGDVVGYVDISLAANTNYQFTMKDLLTNDIYKNNNAAVQYMTYTNHTDWGFATDYTYNCGITTAGKGTYRFTWNVTDKTMTVTYPTSYQVNYGASVGGSVTSVKDDDNNDVPNGGYVKAGGSVVYTASANTGYTFVGWCGSDAYGDVFTDYNPWTNSGVAAASNAYAKFKSTNFVIYRTGDMAEDDRAALDDVESYDGGTISETIEFRMKVRELDKWYSLCLPFEVNAVKVWEAGTYYDLVPFYRPVVGSKTYYTGDYIIRTPKQVANFPISEFADWRDPESADDYLPSKNTPYIIQWHDSYFAEEGGRYISFFGETGQDIPSFSAGSAPVSDNVVNVCVNTSMQSGSVTGAYLLDPDYGGGAWLRGETVDAKQTVNPFECYLLANSPTRALYRVIRRDTGTNGATGFETVMPDANTNKVLINGQLFIIRDNKMYNVMGMEVQK